MDLHVTTSDVGAVPVLALTGLADLASVPMLQDHLRRAVAHRPGGTVMVDLDGLSVLDDTALGVLLGAAAHARDRGGDLEVVCTDSRLRSRLSATRFDLAVAVRDSVV